MSYSENDNLTDEQKQLKEQLVRQINQDAKREKKSSISSMPNHSTLEEFIDAVAHLIDYNQQKADKPVVLKDEDTGGNIMEHPKYVNEDLGGVVLYSLVKRAPGTMDGGNEPFNRGRREIKPRIRQVEKGEGQQTGRAVTIRSQWFDNAIKFKIVARSATQANRLALWFEELMEENRYYFAGAGIVKYHFDEREKDEFMQIGNEPYYCRPLVYYVRTERTTEMDEQALNNIVVCLTSLNKENQNGTR
jgi:hypothetical protein